MARLKASAKSRNLPFSLRYEDLLNRPTTCEYLGIPLNYRSTKLQHDSGSVNRIDSSKGYEASNIEIISNKANTMLQNATKEELIFFAKKILEKYE